MLHGKYLLGKKLNLKQSIILGIYYSSHTLTNNIVFAPLVFFVFIRIPTHLHSPILFINLYNNCIYILLKHNWSFPGGSYGKISTCNVGDLGSIPGLGRFPGEGNGYPLQLA